MPRKPGGIIRLLVAQRQIAAGRGKYGLFVVSSLSLGLPADAPELILSDKLAAYEKLVGEQTRELPAAVAARSRPLILPGADHLRASLLGGETERSARNRLVARWIAQRFGEWCRRRVELKIALSPPVQSLIVARSADGTHDQALVGGSDLSAEGLGLAPPTSLQLTQATDSPEETAAIHRARLFAVAFLANSPSASVQGFWPMRAQVIAQFGGGGVLGRFAAILFDITRRDLHEADPITSAGRFSPPKPLYDAALIKKFDEVGAGGTESSSAPH